MTTPFPSPDALRFSITSMIVTWEPFERRLRIGTRNLWVNRSGFSGALVT